MVDLASTTVGCVLAGVGDCDGWFSLHFSSGWCAVCGKCRGGLDGGVCLFLLRCIPGSDRETAGACADGAVTGISFLGSTLALLLYNLGTHTSLHIPDMRALAALLGLAVVCQLLGYFFLTYALGHLSSTVTSVTLLLIAPLTAVIALALFGESVGGPQVVGGALVLVGVGLTNFVSARRGRISSAV